jgi:menaquinone-dependent protoporphyrinogen oxidase
VRILVTYDPHNEQVPKTAKFVAEMLRREGNEVELADLSQKEIDILVPYDKILVGGDIWFGKLGGVMRKYLLKNQTELLIKPTFLFIHSYAGDEEFKSQLVRALPLEILSHALTFNLGMDVDTDELNPIEKIKWKLTGQHVDTPSDEQNIREFIGFVLR